MLGVAGDLALNTLIPGRGGGCRRRSREELGQELGSEAPHPHLLQHASVNQTRLEVFLGLCWARGWPVAAGCRTGLLTGLCSVSSYLGFYLMGSKEQLSSFL